MQEAYGPRQHSAICANICNMQAQSKRRVQLGPTGQQVMINVRRIRERHHFSQSHLARLTADTNHPLAASAINEIENGARRVDVDDLLVLAAVLGVNTNALLMPDRVGEDVDIELSGVGTVGTIRAWQWARGHATIVDDPADEATGSGHLDDEAAFRMRISPRKVPPRSSAIAERKLWKIDQLVQLGQEVQVLTTEPDMAAVGEQMLALAGLDPEIDDQWQLIVDSI